MEHLNNLHTFTWSSTKKPKISRPINCFMAFRSEKHQEISSHDPKINNRDISKIIAKWWKQLTEEEKAPYRAIAMKAKAEHELKYPNYTYKPIKKSQRRVRPYRRREDAITRKRKAEKNELRLKPWLGEDTDSAPSPSSITTTITTPSTSATTTPTFQDSPVSSVISSSDDNNNYINMDFNLFLSPCVALTTPTTTTTTTTTYADDLFSTDLFSSPCDSMDDNIYAQPPPLPLFDLGACFYPESDPLFPMPMDFTSWSSCFDIPSPTMDLTPDLLSLENFLQC